MYIIVVLTSKPRLNISYYVWNTSVKTFLLKIFIVAICLYMIIMGKLVYCQLSYLVPLSAWDKILPFFLSECTELNC